MNKLEQIKQEIMSLNPDNVWKLAEWLDEFKNELWDKQIEADAKAGKLDVLAGRALTNSKTGTRMFKGKRGRNQF
jgi:hypothetical protein